MSLEDMSEEEQQILINMGLFLRDKMIEANLLPYDTTDYIEIQQGYLKGIPIYQTVHVPADAIVVHPFIMGKIIKYNGADQVVDMILKKGK